MRRSKIRFGRVTFIALMLAAPPIYSASASASSLDSSEISALDPGEYIWQPQLAPVGEVEIVVSLPLQAVYVYRGGTLIGASTASTGKAGHDTPTGTFNILQKRRDHRSNLYNDAPMPFMQRLTWDGVALHAGQIPGYPASHGCIRLPDAFARNLFEITSLGAAVHVVDSAPSPDEALTIARAGNAGGMELASNGD